MRRIFIIFCLLTGSLQAQQNVQDTNLSKNQDKPIFPPIQEQHTFPLQEIRVPLKAYSPRGNDIIFEFTWDRGGKIDQKQDLFIWTPKENDIGQHPIIFTAVDTLSGQRVNQPALIVVNPIRYQPVLSIECHITPTEGFYYINEGEELALVIRAEDRNTSDELTLGYFVNEDPNARIKNARFSVNGRGATFFWIPTNSQAGQGLFNLTFFVEDQTGLRNEKVIPVIVRDVKHPPVFQNTTREYYINEGEPLSFTVKAQDLDDEPLTYQVTTPDIKKNDFSFNPSSGKFQWIPDFSYSTRKTEYQLIFSANDAEFTVYDTILVKVDPKNYPPHIEAIRPRDVKEGEEVVVPIRVSDKNGDENVSLSVISSDIKGYEFDPEQRIFRWTPPFSFLDSPGKKEVHVTFLASDGHLEDEAELAITVHDRNDPREIVQEYITLLTIANQMKQEVAYMDDNLQFTLDRKRFWNDVFDISGIVIGAVTGFASSSVASDKFQKTVVPIAAAATTLIGVRAVIDRSSDKIAKLRSEMLFLKGNLDVSVNMVLRDYGYSPKIETADTYEFQNDFRNFKKRIEELETQKGVLQTRYEALPIKERK